MSKHAAKTRTIGLAIMPVLLFLLCCTPEAARPKDKLLVVTTTGLIADAVRNIADNQVDVVALMGPGVDPHLYKASHGDVNAISDADILFYNGLHLEGKMGSIFEKTARTKTVVAVSKDIPTAELREIPGFRDTYDPHIWFDIRLWKRAVTTIEKTLREKDPVNAEVYAKNAKRYLDKLDSLHQVVHTLISTIPEEQRVLITAHDAFGYFGDAYAMEVKGLQGISTLSEFGLKDVTGLVDFIIERRIRAIFPETSVSEKFIRAIVEGCGKRNWNVRIGHSLYSDALGGAGTPAENYVGMVDSNVRTIVNALK